MKREIKFRGYDDENKVWRYGHFFESIEGARRCYNIVENRDTRYYCASSSISEFTGLHDKNGKEIYEGDVVLSQGYLTAPYAKKARSKRFNVLVEWDSKNSCYRTECSSADNRDRAKYAYGQWGDFFDVEIIGNIYENPELLEG